MQNSSPNWRKRWMIVISSSVTMRACKAVGIWTQRRQTLYIETDSPQSSAIVTIKAATLMPWMGHRGVIRLTLRPSSQYKTSWALRDLMLIKTHLNRPWTAWTTLTFAWCIQISDKNEFQTDVKRLTWISSLLKTLSLISQIPRFKSLLQIRVKKVTMLSKIQQASTCLFKC